MLTRLKGLVPSAAKQVVKMVLESFRKTGLKYVELHLTDHCNLNCKGCSHYSSLAPPRYADIRQHERDLRRLKELVGTIGTIRLLGGEPLLHPDPAPFITVTRAIFPESEIRLVTNGILLLQAPPALWEACRATATTVQVTVYPPLRPHVDKLRSLCEAQGVKLIISGEIQAFEAHLNLKGDSDKHEAFNVCRSRHFCPFLRDGHLYTCWMPALTPYFNKLFGYHIPVGGGINIHARSASRERIMRYLSRPIPTCRWCSHEFVPFPWAKTERRPEEWDAEEQKQLAGSGAALHREPRPE